VSGICGVVRLDGAEASRADLERQTRQLAHLGPDRVESFCEGPAAMAHLMMRITEEDRLDAQPLHHDDLSLVADLRLDNREELATALAIDAVELKDMPDSALLFAAYRTWGVDCVERLVGDFAFAVWDANKRTLTLARDHMGQRHVFYHQGQGFFAFASEIKGLWCLPDIPRVLNEERVALTLLRMEADEPGATDYEGVHAVPGGAILTLGADGKVETRRYWEPRPDPRHVGHDEAYYIATYRKVVEEAVACRLRRTIHPAGLLMGGGFDSGGICAMAGPVLGPKKQKLIAVSSVMPEDYRGDIRHAREWVEVCRRFMPHLDVRYVTAEGLDIFSFMEVAFLTSDCRHSPYRYVTHSIFATIKSAGARTVMDGHGGNYTVNPVTRDTLPRLLFRGQFRQFVSEFRAMRRHLRQTTKQTLVRNLLFMMRPVWLADLEMRWRNGLALFGPPLPMARAWRTGGKQRSRSNRRRPLQQSARMLRVLRRQQGFPSQGYSVPAAQHGLEFTQPFHDKRVVEFGLAIPAELYAKNGKTRYLARLALKDLYPPEYQERPTRHDDLAPDFLAMSKRVESRILEEIDRMEKAGRLSRHFDFALMRRMLTRRTIGQHASGNEYDTRAAHKAFLHARYVEWFRGDNA
jgi:asparagine synthase (glutamine-hydrolysing)